MYCIDPDRIDLALAFKADVFAPRSGELAALCTALRMGPVAGKYVLLQEPPGRLQLARLGGRRHAPLQRLGVFFDTPEAAEWEVFRLRWQEATGRSLPP